MALRPLGALEAAVNCHVPVSTMRISPGWPLTPTASRRPSGLKLTGPEGGSSIFGADLPSLDQGRDRRRPSHLPSRVQERLVRTCPTWTRPARAFRRRATSEPRRPRHWRPTTGPSDSRRHRATPGHVPRAPFPPPRSGGSTAGQCAGVGGSEPPAVGAEADVVDAGVTRREETHEPGTRAVHYADSSPAATSQEAAVGTPMQGLELARITGRR